MNRRLLLTCLLAGLGLVLAGACGSAPTAAPSPVTVRVGYLLADLHHIAYVVGQDAEAGGGTSFYDQYGVRVEDAAGAPYANGGVEMDHFAAGDVDLGMLGAPPAITKHLNAAVDIRVIAQVNALGSALVVGPNVQTPQDLLGQTVAVPGHAAIQFFLLLNFAQQKGLDIGDITVVDMPPPDMRVKLEAGEIAGFLAWEPWPADAVSSGAGKVMATSSDIWPDHLDCVVAVDRAFAEAQPETVRRFLQAHVAATRWIQEALAQPGSPEYAHLVDLGAAFTQRSTSVVEAAFSNITFRSDLDSGFNDSIKAYTEKLIEFGLIPPEKLTERGYSSVDDFVAHYVDPSFIQAIPGP
ncbi:MAG TPA: ABC transporter substrate-binding protein [Anaerolineales bacterium]|nr:ABC transporter substrate-binding protein [Anaerolineales bacterium]